MVTAAAAGLERALRVNDGMSLQLPARGFGGVCASVFRSAVGQDSRFKIKREERREGKQQG